MNVLHLPPIGPHGFGGITTAQRDKLAAWQPALITWVDPSTETLKTIRGACQESAIVSRLYVPDGEMSGRILADPRAAARWAHDLIMAHSGRMIADFWIVENEVCQMIDELARLNDYMVERVRLADLAGIGAAIGGLSVGQPDLPAADRMACWRLIYPALRAALAGGHVLAIHQYGSGPQAAGPEDRGGKPWHLQRFEDQVWPRLPNDLQALPVAITEYGIDQLLVQSKAAGFATVTTPDAYAALLLEAQDRLEIFRPPIIGASVYCFNRVDERWATYDISGRTVDLLAAASNAPASGGEKLPGPPDPGEFPDMFWDPDLSALRVVDEKILGIPCGYIPAAGMKPGEQYWELVSASFLDEIASKGRQMIWVDAVDGNDRRVNGAEVEFGWPTDTYPYFDGLVTETVAGGGLAQMAVYENFDPSVKPGPYWARMGGLKSGMVYGFGLPWKRHVSATLVFGLFTAPDVAPPPADVDEKLIPALVEAFGDTFADVRATLPTAPGKDYAARSAGNVSKLIIHHSASPAFIGPTQIAQFHIGEGYPGIGYHFLVDSEGRVFYVGDVETARYHAGVVGYDHNETSIGICVIGDYESNDVKIASVIAARGLIDVLRSVLENPFPVFGHGSLPGTATACPGRFLAAWVPYFDHDAETLTQRLLRLGEVNRKIRLNREAALQKAISAAGFVPCSDEFRVSVEGLTDVNPNDPDRIGWLGEHLKTGEVRVFYAKEHDWGNVAYKVRP